jgi:hypothetical protein
MDYQNNGSRSVPAQRFDFRHCLRVRADIRFSGGDAQVSADLVELGGMLLGLFISGYAAGFLIQAIRRFFDQV